MLVNRSFLQIRRREEVCRALLFLRVPRGPVEEGEIKKDYCRKGSGCAIIATHSGTRLLCAFTREIVGLKFEKEEIMKQKLKTHKAMAKRVKITGSGKFMRRKVAINHLRRNKSPEAVRSMDKYFPLATSDTRRMKRLLPYAD